MLSSMLQVLPTAAFLANEALAGACAGTGSFGRVRLVRCEATGQYLALKAIKKADILRMHQVQHIANEKDILASLHHPFIVDLCALTRHPVTPTWLLPAACMCWAALLPDTPAPSPFCH
jgi:hypothetical protein